MANLIHLTECPSDGIPQKIWVNADHILILVPTDNGTEVFFTRKLPSVFASSKSMVVIESPEEICGRALEVREQTIPGP